MPVKIRSGFNAVHAAQYLDQFIEEREVAQHRRVTGARNISVAGYQLAFFIRGRRVSASDLRQLRRWRKDEVKQGVDLGRYDAMLVRYGLHLHDFETWEQAHYGQSSFFDLTADSASATL